MMTLKIPHAAQLTCKSFPNSATSRHVVNTRHSKPDCFVQFTNRMNSTAAPRPLPEPVLLIIADISGYTRYMTTNAKTLSHSYVIISELVEAILHEIELPLEIAKLEGDAVFLYCRKTDPLRDWNETRREVGVRLLAFFRKFAAKVVQLSGSITCTCNACTHLDGLRLKIIVHSGEAIFHRVANFTELAGVDVIAVHRLLKNSVAADQYLLLTEAAHRDLEFPEPLNLFTSNECYADLGQLRTLVHLPPSLGRSLSAAGDSSNHGCRNESSEMPAFPPPDFGEIWRLWCKLWFAPFLRQPNPTRAGYNHVVNSTPFPHRAAFRLFTALLTPLMLPVGILFAWGFALKRQGHTAPHRPHAEACNCSRH